MLEGRRHWSDNTQNFPTIIVLDQSLASIQWPSLEESSRELQAPENFEAKTALMST